MDLVKSWAEKIAAEATPYEIDLAPGIAEAFVKGGKEQEQLFQQPEGGTLGGFGVAESVIVFPLILSALVNASSLLYEVLSSENTSNILSSINNFLEISKVPPEERKEPLPENPYAPLKQVDNIISDALKSSSLSQEERDVIAYKVLKSLLEDSSGAICFIKTLEASKPPFKPNKNKKISLEWLKKSIKRLYRYCQEFVHKVAKLGGGS